MIVLNISTNADVRHDIGFALHKRGWRWGDGKDLASNPLEATFKYNPYFALLPEYKTIKQVITVTGDPPIRAEIVKAGHFIIDVQNEDWYF